MDRARPDGKACLEDGVCEAEACENRLNCPADCGLTCDVQALTSHPPWDVLASEIRVPTSPEEAKQIGVDLDGDGDIDNKLGSVVALVSGAGWIDDPNETFGRRIQDGTRLLAARLWAGQAQAGETLPALGQLLMAEVHDATPTYGGHDTVAVAPGASEDAFLCGEWHQGVFDSQRAAQAVRLPLPFTVTGGGVLMGTFEAVRAVGQAVV